MAGTRRARSALASIVGWILVVVLVVVGVRVLVGTLFWLIRAALVLVVLVALLALYLRLKAPD